MTPHHYPVRRRGERRRLNPNWTAIAWLEADTLADTEIEEVGEPDEDGLAVQRAAGWYRAKISDSSYGRPLLQILGNLTSSSWFLLVTPCPDCDNWAYTSNCRRHDDNTIEGLSEGETRRLQGLYARLDVPPEPTDWETVNSWGSALQSLSGFSATFEEVPNA